MATVADNPTAEVENQPDVYTRRRLRKEGVTLDPLPTQGFRHAATLEALVWCWRQQPERQPAVLDVAAGPALVPYYAALVPGFPAFAYHATEQSDLLCRVIKARAPNGSAAVWRWDTGGQTLLAALQDAPDVFLREYPVVLVSHVLDHVADQYAFLDECWELVAPAGYLLVVVPRRGPHRLHFREYDYHSLLPVLNHYASLGGYGNPLTVWEYDSWADLFVAVPKRPPPAPAPVEPDGPVAAGPTVLDPDGYPIGPPGGAPPHGGSR